MEKIKYVSIAFVLFIIFIMPIVLGQTSENKIYVLDLNYNKGTLSSIDVRIKIGFPPERTELPSFNWRVELSSFNNELLYNSTFVIPNIFLQVPPLEGQPTGEPITLENVNFTVILPYHKNGKIINIFNEKNQLSLSVDVSKFAICNMDSICNPNESSETCPEDCKIQLISSQTYLILGAIGIAFIGLVFVLSRKLKSKKKT